MRPVNLIPPEERPGSRKPLRSGPLAYIVVGALAAAVIAITAVVLLGNSIAEKKSEVARLQAEEASIAAKAQALTPYTQFAGVREQRLATVTELANSRFDWARILHELSLVIPADVELTTLSGSVSAGVGTSGGAGIGLRSQIAGPALEMVGCTSSQAAVAAFVEALKDIDGVTRVGFQGSAVSGEGGNATAAGSCGSGGGAQFQLVAAFDAAPAPAPEGSEEIAPEAPPAESTSESTGETASSESSESGSAESTSSESSTSEESEAD
jgi:Tfp pilus assembly protein PilN